MSVDVILAARDLVKTFPGVRALDGVSFDLQRGEIHALLGENGAGKSTFVKILTGAVAADSGKIFLDGRETSFSTPASAFAAGVSIVFQEFSQVGSLSVAENIYLGEWPRSGPAIDWRRIRQTTRELLDRFKVQASPDDRIGELGVGTRQMIEIIKACRKPHTRILILDEPTSALSEVETETLFAFLRGLRALDVSIIYISHRLSEIARICDRMTVFRNGRAIETSPVGRAGVDHIVRLMIGRSLAERFPRKPETALDGGLTVTRLTSPRLRDISFHAPRGLIFGVSGLIGAGKTELLRALFGADPPTGGQISLDGRPVRIDSPRTAAKLGFAFLPENRKEQALVMTANNVFNTSLAALDQFARPFLSLGKERREAVRRMADVEVRPPDPDNMVRNLSGGNQQKVILARWLMARSAVLLFDEPTRGIDVGAKHQIYTLIGDLARRGCCVIIASSEVEELAGICNRVLVMQRGAVVANLAGADVSEARLLHEAAEQREQ